MAYVKATERRAQLVGTARAVLCRDGVAGTTLRAVAAEADVPLGTLHYVFSSKELLITAVLEDIRSEISAVFEATETDAGLEQAIRDGLQSYWEQLVVKDPDVAVMRHELFIHALRTPGLQSLARWQIEGYTRIVAERSQEAVGKADEICAVPFDTLARVLVGSIIGIVLHYLNDHDRTRSERDLQAAKDMLVRLADVHPAPKTVPGLSPVQDPVIP